MRTPALCGLLLVLASRSALGVSAGRAERPNVLVIGIETLRRDHVGCYGYERNTTPVLDRLAAEGVRFSCAIAASGWTMPSVMTLFTSAEPWVHHAVTYSHRLAPGLTTLAAELGRAGYQTAGIVSTPTLNGKFGFSRGFDFYDDFTVCEAIGFDFAVGVAAQAGNPEEWTGKKVTRLARAWLARRDRDRPFFLFLFYFDPHYDYLPPEPYDRMFADPAYRGDQTGRGIKGMKGEGLSAADKQQIVALYDGEIRYTDEQIGIVLEELKEQGLYDEAITVVVGDHGDEFWEHGGTAHGHTLYDELVWVPLIVRGPGAWRSGGAIGQQVGLIDVMPTILDMAGLPVPAQCVGRSLGPFLAGQTSDMPPQPVFLESEIEGHLRGARTPKQKVIERDNGRTRECFSLEDDPSEKRNLCGTPREAEFAALVGRLQEWKVLVSRKAEEPSPSAGGKPELDPELLRQLRSLKYVR